MPKGLRDRLDCKDHRVTRDLKGQWGHRDRRVRKVIRGLRDRLDRKDRQALRGHKVTQGPRDCKGLRETLDHKVRRGRWARQDPRVRRASGLDATCSPSLP